MVNTQTAPEGFNNTDWQLHKGNKDHARFLDKCIEATWLIWEGQQLTGEAFFKQPWLAEKLELSIRHTQNVIAELLSRKIIEVDRRDQNYYKVTEFFSMPLGEWTKVAAAKIKAALAEFFAKTTSQQSSTQKQTGNPKKESFFRTTKAKTPAATAPSTGQQVPSQLSEQERAAIEKQALEENIRLMAEQEAKYQEEEKQITQETKENIQQVAEQVARENHHRTKPDKVQFCVWVNNKLTEYGIKAPRWFVGRIASEILDKHRYKFR